MRSSDYRRGDVFNLDVAISCFLLIACNFGGLLFFSNNSNIMNPEMPIWPSMVKDALWLCFIGSVFFFRQGPMNRTLLRISIVTAFLWLFWILVYTFRNGTGWDINWLKSTKNVVFYMWTPVLLASIIDLDSRRLFLVTIKVISITLLMSMAVYLIFEADYKNFIPDVRMFGTTGNPNTAAFFSLLLYLLVSAYFDEISAIMRMVYVIIAFTSALMSASFFYLALMLSAFIYWSAFWLRTGRFITLRSYMLQFFFAAALAFILARFIVFWAALPGVAIELRIESLLQDGSVPRSILASDSVLVRAHDFLGFEIFFWGNIGGFRQYDSGILTLAYNYGLVGLLFSLYPIVGLILIRSSDLDACVDRELAKLMVILIIVSGLVHFQITIFPANLVAYIIFAFSLKSTIESRRSTKGCSESH